VTRARGQGANVPDYARFAHINNECCGTGSVRTSCSGQSTACVRTTVAGSAAGTSGRYSVTRPSTSRRACSTAGSTTTPGFAAGGRSTTTSSPRSATPNGPCSSGRSSSTPTTPIRCRRRPLRRRRCSRCTRARSGPTGFSAAPTGGRATSPSTTTRPAFERAYRDCVRSVDAFVDRLPTDLDDDTVVVFHPVHGEAFGDHGVYGHGPPLYEGNDRVAYTSFHSTYKKGMCRVHGDTGVRVRNFARGSASPLSQISPRTRL
jgi:hypothetical protein